MKEYVKPNHKYGKLTAIRVHHVLRHQEYWLFSCECGKEKVIRAASVFFGTGSCGCLIDTGAKKNPEYPVWRNMKARCMDRNHAAFADYGGRGITVCARWVDGEGGVTGFNCFLRDMGSRGESMTLDRIDNEGNYEPGNCRWASMKEQSNNRRNSRFVEIDGQTKTIAEWSEFFGINYRTAFCRISNGWPPLKAFTQPPRKLKMNAA